MMKFTPDELQGTKCALWSLRNFRYLLVLFAIYALPAAANGAIKDSISVKLKNTTVDMVFSHIESNSDYLFLISGEARKELSRKVDIDVENQPVDKVLGQLLAGTGLSYSIIGQQITIHKKEAQAEKPQSPPARTAQAGGRVKGVVIDSNGEPLAGVTVTVTGTHKGVFTDSDGRFEITASEGEKLLFSVLGYENQTIEVGEKREITIVLRQHYEIMSEVQVVAFGKQKKESVISSITTVKPAELKVPSSNLTTALAGRIPGLISYQRSGEPGMDNAEFFIRGVTTFGYAKSPLILLDGLEVTSADLARLQPDDIESFSIMKDATAAALYGARGANGVIIVTTKEGAEGKVKVSVRYEMSVSGPTKMIELADPVNYMRLHNEAVLTRDPSLEPPYTMEAIESTAKGVNPMAYPATDWYDQLMKRNTINQRLNFNVSGGGKVARYYIAGTYNIDNGNMKIDRRNNFNNNIKLNRYALRSNVNINVTPTTEAAVRLYGTFDDYSGPLTGGADLYSRIMRTSPVLFPAYYEPDKQHENVGHIMFGNHDDGTYINPYAEMTRGYKDYSTSTIIAQFEASQKLDFIVKGLKIRGLFSTTRYAYFDISRGYTPFYYAKGSYNRQTDEYVLVPLNPSAGTEYINVIGHNKNVNSNTYLEGAIDYASEFSEDHQVGALLVYYQRQRINTNNLSSIQQSLPFRNTGLSGRLTYAYKSRYFIEGSFGYNGSERFARNHRFGFFPSVGLGWLVSNEPFFQGKIKNIIPEMKLKATYGKVGNDAVYSDDIRFYYMSEVNMNDSSKQYTFGSDFLNTKPGIGIGRYENPLITWETATKTNIGLEMNLLSIFDINLDVYKEKRINIVQQRSSVPATAGFQSVPLVNYGQAESKGMDFSIDINKSFNRDFWVTGRVNLTYATSKYLVYDEPDYNKTPWKSAVGQAIGQQWGYVAERLFVDENDVKNSPYQFGDTMGGDIKFKDINGDGVIDEFDQVPIGYPTSPEIVYGFGFSLGFKGIDFSCFFQGMARESFWIDASATAPFIDTDGNASIRSQNALLKAYADNHWSETNRDIHALWPRLSNEVSQNNTARSTWFMRNGSFLRLKSVELGYSLPERWTEKARMSRVRVYFSGTNLLTFSVFKLWDPEMAGNGLGYPIQRVYNFGIQLSL